MAQATHFRDLATAMYPDTAFPRAPSYTQVVNPVILHDPRTLNASERDGLVTQYLEYGFAHFVCEGVDDLTIAPFTSALDTALQAIFPEYESIDHPKQEHNPSNKHVGVLVRGQAGANKMGPANRDNFALHQDGLGSAGGVDLVSLVMLAPPLAGGFSLFQNILQVALDLSYLDWEAFQQLFLPTALTIIRPTGPRALSVTGPVLYLDAMGRPRVNFVGVGPSSTSVDYRVAWPDCDKSRRALEYLLTFSVPFAPHSHVCHLDRTGSGVLINNAAMIHGRTAFRDGRETSRVVARKWFTGNSRLSQYRHAPGLDIKPDLAALRPDLFGPEFCSGEWRFSERERRNVRLI